MIRSLHLTVLTMFCALALGLAPASARLAKDDAATVAKISKHFSSVPTMMGEFVLLFLLLNLMVTEVRLMTILFVVIVIHPNDHFVVPKSLSRNDVVVQKLTGQHLT